MNLRDLSKLCTGVEQYLQSLSPDKKFIHFKQTGNQTIVSNALGILLGYSLYGTEFLRSAQVEYLVSHFLDSQKEDSGKIVDPLQEKYPANGLAHANYLEWQSTYYALLCIDLLFLRPKYRLSFFQEILQTPYTLVEWIESLNWEKPWRISNDIMFLLTFVHSSSIGYLLEERFSFTKIILDWLDAHQDHETGLWIAGKNKRQLWEGMGAAYHFLPFYKLYNRPVNFTRNLLLSICDLQHSDGLFHIDGGGGACSDMDAAEMLIKLETTQPSYRDIVEDVLLKMLPGLWDCYHPDGGFSEKMQAVCEVDEMKNFAIEYGGWAAMRYQVCQSDIWSTWCRFKTIVLIHRFFNDPEANSLVTSKAFDWR